MLEPRLVHVHAACMQRAGGLMTGLLPRMHPCCSAAAVLAEPEQCSAAWLVHITALPLHVCCEQDSEPVHRLQPHSYSLLQPAVRQL